MKFPDVKLLRTVRTDLTDLFVSLFCLVLNFSYTNVFGWSSGRFRFVVLDFHMVAELLS